MSSSELPWIRNTRIGAYGLCVEHERLLVIRKAKGPYTGLFDLPGGGIEFGETPEETVAREFMEETGTQISVEGLAGTFSRVVTFISDDRTKQVELHHLGFLFRVRQAKSGAAVKTDPDGLDSLGAVWLPLADAHPDRISPLVAEGLRCLGLASGE